MKWTPEALAAAIGVLTIGFCAAAVRVAQTYAAVVNIVEGLHRSGVSIRGAQGAGAGNAHTASVSVGGVTNTSSVLPIPLESQRKDITVTSAPAWTGSVDCGPECVVALLQYEHGQETIAQLLRLRYFGVIDMRLTDANDLTGMLKMNDVQAHPRYTDVDTACSEITNNLNAGRPAVVLLKYIGGSTPHWYVVSGHPGNTWVLMDPWIGANVTAPDAVFRERYAGQYVHIDAMRPQPRG